MSTDKNESKVKLGEDELNLAAGGMGGGGLPKYKFKSIQSSSSGCIHGFNATCEQVGIK